MKFVITSRYSAGVRRMDHFTASLVYLLIFRLAVIAVGTISIILGYKLFPKGEATDAGEQAASDINARIGATKLTLKKVAPGSCFALFGIILISVMVMQSAPEVTFRQLKGGISAPSEDHGDTLSEIILKSRDTPRIVQSTDSALRLLAAGDTAEAIGHLRAQVSCTAPAMNALAWLLLYRGNADEALPYSLSAVNLDPANADYRHTLASVHLRRNDSVEYKRHLSEAGRLNAGKYGKY